MSKVQPRTLSGFMELMPARQIQFDRMMAVLRESYSLYGFTPLDTPIIEASEVLLAKGGGETEKQIYRFQKGDADLSLRSARYTGASGPSGAASGSSIRRISTSSATASWTSPTTRKFPPSSTAPSPRWA